ncbi:hypothetical protein PDESU_05923 [Pontiella desulfatans]|uniref:Lipoprotein n=1 Tax=Pontiella desulfatans TaxID=2750659 RepID=A0A6C2UCM2_PONDE|nr:hypothetical protein [Pontiella desulfatans]VGO17327.1 hypothetical protein PDESU_05923 [Pontiella desulfatans]
MKQTAFILLAATVSILIAGCATTDDGYVDDQEYSNMPWNTPQQWEGSRSVPGLSGQNY